MVIIKKRNYINALKWKMFHLFYIFLVLNFNHSLKRWLKQYFHQTVLNIVGPVFGQIFGQIETDSLTEDDFGKISTACWIKIAFLVFPLSSSRHKIFKNWRAEAKTVKFIFLKIKKKTFIKKASKCDFKCQNGERTKASLKALSIHLGCCFNPIITANI